MILCLRGADLESVYGKENRINSRVYRCAKQRIIGRSLDPGLAIEVLGSGKKRWRYRRQVSGTKVMATLFGGLFPTKTIAAAREWASELNEKVEAGIDPREARREEKMRAEMTVARAHGLYMAAVREGRASRAKRKNKPRTISDKQEIFDRDVPAKLKTRSRARRSMVRARSPASKPDHLPSSKARLAASTALSTSPGPASAIAPQSCSRKGSCAANVAPSPAATQCPSISKSNASVCESG
jgi:hypothetical protein